MLRRSSGELLTVSRSSAADLDPCHFRRVVMASTIPGGADLSAYVSVAGIRGSLVERGAGSYATSPCDRWFATSLGPDTTSAVLNDVASHAACDDLEAALSVDSHLGVTVVHLVTHDPGAETGLDTASHQAIAACLVEELIRRSRSRIPRSGRAPITDRTPRTASAPNPQQERP